MDKKFKMNILSKIQFGSKLYGTNIPTSDDDYRAVYLPTLEECVLLRAKDAWEDKSEEDTSFFSLQHLMKMAAQGQSAAVELICADSRYWKSSSPFWEYIHENRKIFFSKNMHSFIGYAKAMAGKYSSRVDRLNEMENLLNHLNSIKQDEHNNRLGDFWDGLPESLNAVKGVNNLNKSADKRVYHVCGRELQPTSTISHVISIVETILQGYGERVKKAQSADMDYKALMHAFRAAYQVQEIVETGDLKFPLRDCEYLRDMRSGKINFMENKLDEKLDGLISDLQIKISNSSLPERVNQSIIDKIILDAYKL